MKNLVIMAVLAFSATTITKLIGAPSEAQMASAIVTLLFFIGMQLDDLRSKLK